MNRYAVPSLDASLNDLFREEHHMLTHATMEQRSSSALVPAKRKMSEGISAVSSCNNFGHYDSNCRNYFCNFCKKEWTHHQRSVLPGFPRSLKKPTMPWLPLPSASNSAATHGSKPCLVRHPQNSPTNAYLSIPSIRPIRQNLFDLFPLLLWFASLPSHDNYHCLSLKRGNIQWTPPDTYCRLQVCSHIYQGLQIDIDFSMDEIMHNWLDSFNLKSKQNAVNNDFLLMVELPKFAASYSRDILPNAICRALSFCNFQYLKIKRSKIWDLKKYNVMLNWKKKRRR